jgi:carbonic anhydrase
MARIFALFLYAIMVALLPALALASGPFDYHAFSAGKGERPWQQRPGSFCHSTEQSPIDIMARSDLDFYQPMDAAFAPDITLPKFAPGSVTANNNGHNVNLQFEPAAGVIFRYPRGKSFTALYGPFTGTGKLDGEVVYNAEKDAVNTDGRNDPEEEQGTLVDLHWHVPSEHAIDGGLHAAEAHFLHKINRPNDPDCTYMVGETGPFCLAVVSVLYDLHHDGSEELNNGYMNEVLSALGGLPSYGDNDTAAAGIEVDFDALLPPAGERQFWSYRGSLTTPECNENVTWIVMQSHMKLDWTHYNMLHQAILHEELGTLNARPPLPLNSRTVFVSNYDTLMPSNNGDHSVTGAPADDSAASAPAVLSRFTGLAALLAVGMALL